MLVNPLCSTRRSSEEWMCSAGSQIIFRVRRPFYLINSHMNIEDGEGNVIGEVHQRWHLWRRNYSIYIDKRQFAAIDGNFLAWEFTLTDEKGGMFTAPQLKPSSTSLLSLHQARQIKIWAFAAESNSSLPAGLDGVLPEQQLQARLDMPHVIESHLNHTCSSMKLWL